MIKKPVLSHCRYSTRERNLTPLRSIVTMRGQSGFFAHDRTYYSYYDNIIFRADFSIVR